jgi:hypothetical protein
LFIVVQHITLTVIMEGEIFLGQKDVALADTMLVARLMALGPGVQPGFNRHLS